MTLPPPAASAEPPAAWPVRNPRSGEVDYQFIPADSDTVHQTAAALREGQTGWLALGLEGRIAILRQWQEVLRASRADLHTTLFADTGRMRETGIELDAIPRLIDGWCRQAAALLQPEPARASSSVPFIQVEMTQDPWPLVGVISPWNFPLLLSLIDAVPALLAGAAVLVKPSEVTPRFVEPLRKTLQAVPALAGVLGIVQGAGPTGADLIQAVDAICFTGSVATGRKVAAAAAARFIPAFLELGGKDPALVLEGADLDLASSAILSGSISNAGQACQALERIYVARPVFDAFVSLLVQKAERIRLSWPDPAVGELGPIIFDRQADILTAHLQDAVAKGARILTGGRIERHGGGHWCRPTVLVDVDHSMQVMTEESFGPLLPVMPFDSLEQAVRLANDSEYGLSATVFAGGSAATLAEARAVAGQLQVGAVSINDAALTSFVHDAEKNSRKLSGLGGSRMGPVGLTRFLRRKALLINATGRPSPWWMAGPA
jgi:succinate-semialdehyde dehydrogenase / glutarate-semialdehyde dehydrogenase